MKTTVHHTSKREWGFETLLTVTDDNGDFWGECIVTKEYPKSYDAVIAEAEANVTKRLAIKAAEVEPEITYTKSEIEAILKEKELLGADEDLEDLKSKTELTAEKEAVK